MEASILRQRELAARVGEASELQVSVGKQAGQAGGVDSLQGRMVRRACQWCTQGTQRSLGRWHHQPARGREAARVRGMGSLGKVASASASMDPGHGLQGASGEGIDGTEHETAPSIPLTAGDLGQPPMGPDLNQGLGPAQGERDLLSSKGEAGTAARAPGVTGVEEG